MITDIFETFIPILAIICAVGLPIGATAYIVIIMLRSRAKERMEFIKQGIVPQSQPKPMPNKYVALRNGFLCVGVALGLIVGIIVEESLRLENPLNVLVALASVLFFLGIAYILFFLITKNKNDEE